MTDLSAIHADSGNHDAAALEADGSQLTTDATAAAAIPEPADPTSYKLAMIETAGAGIAIEQGNFELGTQYLGDASSTIQSVTAATGIS